MGAKRIYSEHFPTHDLGAEMGPLRPFIGDLSWHMDGRGIYVTTVTFI